MVTYYLTEMNTTKLENVLLQFIYKQHLNTILVNGVTAKIISLMYENKIDYYYSDLLASCVDVPIKFVDNIYMYNQGKYYAAPLHQLLSSTEYTGTPTAADQLEHDVLQILNTKKRIHNMNKKKFN